jgi:hypothetical protein
MHRVGAGHDEAEDRVPALVVRDALAVLAAQQQRPLGAEHDLLERVEEVLLAHVVLLAPRGEQRRLVDEVPQVGAREPGVDAGELAEVRRRARAARCACAP